MNNLIELIVFGFLLVSTITDNLTSKIKNELVLFVLLFGVTSNSIAYGFAGMTKSFSGIVIPFVCLIILYAVGMLGAGDIKCLSAIGGCLGIMVTVEIFLFGMTIAGIYGFIKMLSQHRTMSRLVYLFNYIKQTYLTKMLIQYSDLKNEDHKHTIKLSGCFFIGYLIYLIKFW